MDLSSLEVKSSLSHKHYLYQLKKFSIKFSKRPDSIQSPIFHSFVTSKFITRTIPLPRNEEEENPATASEGIYRPLEAHQHVWISTVQVSPTNLPILLSN